MYEEDNSLEEVSTKELEKNYRTNNIKKSKNRNIKTINKKNGNLKNTIHFEEKKPQLFGLENIGNSCYMNSFLQILFHTPHFLESLKQSYKVPQNNDFINSIIKFSENHNKKILRIIKTSMSEEDESFGKDVQNDSQEFGIDMINKIISIIKGNLSFCDDYCDNCNKKDNVNEKHYKKIKFEEYKNKYCKNETPLDKMFTFHEIIFKMEKDENNGLNFKNIDFNSCLNIDLPFPYNNTKSSYNLTELLKEYYPKLPNTEQKKSERFFEKIKKIILQWFFKLFKGKIINIDEINDIKEFFYSNLVTLPNILIISINRIIHGNSFLSKFFNNRLIFEEKLDLKDYLENDFKDEDTNYELYAVNECYKKLFFTGHYYSYVKIDNHWYKFDDLNFEKVEQLNMDSEYVVGLYYIKKSFLDEKKFQI